jgi:hypothetical protein
MKTHKNIRFNYLYHGADDISASGSVCFGNPEKLTLEEIDESIRKRLINKGLIDADNWHLPDLFFHSSGVIDRGLCEYRGVELTRDSPTDKRSILEFLEEISYNKISC